jgi:hypothetical protein
MPRPIDPGSLVLDAFELQEGLVGMAIPRGRRTRGRCRRAASIVAPWVLKVGSTSLLISRTALREMRRVEAERGEVTSAAEVSDRGNA